MNKEILTETIQIRTTSAFKARLVDEARKRTMSYSKLLQKAFWEFIESQHEFLDK